MSIVAPAEVAQTLEITATDLHNRASFGNEVWVEGVYRADGTQIDPNGFLLEGAAEVRGDVVVLNGATAKLRWEGKTYRPGWLVLSGHQWSGVATISWNGTRQTIDLYARTGKRHFILLDTQSSDVQSIRILPDPIATIIRASCNAFTLVFSSSLILYAYVLKSGKKFNASSINFHMSRYQNILAILTVFMLSFVLRLYAIQYLNANDIISGWDAKDYWTKSQEVRNFFCNLTMICSANTILPSSIESIIINLTGRPGLLPIITGIILGLFPNHTTTIHLLFAVSDSICCILIIDLLRKLKSPLWVALLGGIIQAVYIPSVIGTVTFLQQPVIRLCIILVVWAYVRAFSSEHYSTKWITVGGIATFLFGFSVLTLRPVMWLILGTVCLCLIINKKTRPYLKWHFLVISSVIGLLCLTAGLLSVFIRDQAWLLTLITGWSNQTANIATTPVSFPYFWPPNDYPNILTISRSLTEQLTSMPHEFVDWLLFSIFANWYYPDYLYFQEFILTIDQQKAQHLILLILAIVGMVWLAGQQGAKQQYALLASILVGSMSLIYGIISVEPRRFSALSSIIAIGGASCVWAMASFTVTRPLIQVRLGIALACLGALWLTPLAIIAALVPLSPSLAYSVLTLMRITATGLCGLWLLRWWQRTIPNYIPWVPGTILVCILVFIGYNMQRLDWREWETSSNALVQQHITGVQSQAHLWPWLIIDIGDAQQARDSAIEINGKMIKPVGVPMARWEDKSNPFFPIQDLESISNAGIKAHTWFAIPVDKALLNAKTMMVEVRPPLTGASLRGDYVDASTGQYIGPLRDPWKTDQSLWRWQWNADDPRIYWTQLLDNHLYVSHSATEVSTIPGDLAPEIGRQSGLFRIFLVQQPFGPLTNVVSTETDSFVSSFATYQGCDSPGDQLLVQGKDLPYLCRNSDQSVSYFAADGQKIGTSGPEVFQQNRVRNSLAETIVTTTSMVTKVEIIQVYATGFVANFYSAPDRLLYSFAFEHRQKQ